LPVESLMVPLYRVVKSGIMGQVPGVRWQRRVGSDKLVHNRVRP